MSNYYAHCKTNYFVVKEGDKFKAVMGSVPDIELQKGEGDNSFQIIGNNPDGAGWPCSCYNEKTEEDEDLDIFNLVAEHLVDNEVAIFQEVGYERLRYLVGYSIAINNKKELIQVNLEDIYKQAEKLTDGSRVINTTEN